ncbi:MAG TPA: hypothetical protein VL966_06680 [Alphaproteobacteria bacterium]|nr:hypothetical protein [Alphaproteobacteria bacterium]
MRTLQRIHTTARRARELAAEFRTDRPLRDALMAYAVEVEIQARERLGADREVSGLDDGLTDETLSEAASPSDYWRRECAFLRECMLSLMPGDGRRRVLQSLAEDCHRLAEMLEARTK